MMNVRMVETQEPQGSTLYTFSFDRVLTVEERTSVEQHMKRQWGTQDSVELDADFLDQAIRNIQVSRLQRLHNALSEHGTK